LSTNYWASTEDGLTLYVVFSSLLVIGIYDIFRLAMLNLISKPEESTNKKMRILIADDHPLIRFALKKIFEEYNDMEVVAEVGDGESAVKAAVELAPDVAVIDITMPALNGLEATRQIKAKCPSVLVLILTVHSDIEHIFGIFDAGADGYLTKTVLGHEVVRSIQGLMAGRTVLSPEVFKLVLKHALKYPIKPLSLPEVEHLTCREQEILLMAADGMGNKEIAERLGLRSSTVKSYFVEIFLKLGVRSRTEAVIKSLRSGLITLDKYE